MATTSQTTPQTTPPQPTPDWLVTPPPTQRSDSDEIDLLALWRVLWQRKWGILFLVVVVMMLTTLVVSTLTPIYRATATILFEQQAGRVVSIEQIYSLEGAGQEFIQTQIELLQSRGLAERVVRRLNLHTHVEFDPRQQPDPWLDLPGLLRNFEIAQLIPGVKPTDLEERVVTEEEIISRVTRALMDRIQVEPVRRSQLVRIHVEMADPFMATEVANMLARSFIDGQMEARFELSMSATNWMAGRMEELRDSLRQAEAELQGFRDAEDLVDVSGIMTVSANELAAISERMINARRERAEAESAFRQVQAMRGESWERLASVPAVLSNSLVQSFRAEEARAQARVDELSGRYGPRHPTMQAAQSDLASARASLRAQVEQVVASIEQSYRLAAANEATLQRSVEANRAQIQELSRQEFRLRELQREVETQRSLYDTFMTRLQETSATIDLETANARVIDPATVPDHPVRPQNKAPDPAGRHFSGSAGFWFGAAAGDPECLFPWQRRG